MVSSSPENLDYCGYNAPTNQLLFNWLPAMRNGDVAFAMKPVNNSSFHATAEKVHSKKVAVRKAN